MTKAAKIRVLLLLPATFITLLALTPPKPAQACFAYEIDTCYYANGTSCQESDCPKYNNCNGSEVRCYYQRTVCCT
jgi:hypothetical protein